MGRGIPGPAAYASTQREEREARKRSRELERQSKEQARLSEIEQAQLEVSRYENRLDLLLSIHKEQGPVWDWYAVAARLTPPEPQRHRHHELRVKQQGCLADFIEQPDTSPAILHARLKDEEEFEHARRNHTAELSSLAKLMGLARRILAKEPGAFTEALIELSPFGEIDELGTTLHFTVHNAELLEATLKVKSTEVIPNEVKSLTSTGKLSSKRMARAKFHELYQDYICGCILRVAREVFALLPVNRILLTAFADLRFPGDENPVERPVLSTIVERAALAGLDFAHLDPSDAIDSFEHRGDFKASRKAGAFAPIKPLTTEDLDSVPAEACSYADLLTAASQAQEELRSAASELNT